MEPNLLHPRKITLIENLLTLISFTNDLNKNLLTNK